MLHFIKLTGALSTDAAQEIGERVGKGKRFLSFFNSRGNTDKCSELPSSSFHRGTFPHHMVHLSVESGRREKKTTGVLRDREKKCS